MLFPHAVFPILKKRTFFEDTAKVRLYFFLPKLFEGNFATRTDEPATGSKKPGYPLWNNMLQRKDNRPKNTD